MFRAEIDDQLWNVLRHGRGNRAEAEHAAALHGLNALSDGFQRGLGIAVKRFSGRREGNAPPLARHEQTAQLFFQRGNGITQAGLGDEKRLSGLRIALRLGEHAEIGQLIERHGRPPGMELSTVYHNG